MAPQSPIPIAIVGMACRFPGGATSPEKLWEMLAEGRDAWSEIPSDRWEFKSFYHPDPEAKTAHNAKGGHFIQDDLSTFDAGFFGISPLEAQAMDPQQRLLLETTYEALENAGILVEDIRGSSTAVFAAMFSRDYDRNTFKDAADLQKYHVTGNGEALVANRVSYNFDLRGPSATLDTGCSGGMFALHQACQSLRTGETNMGVVGATQLILSPDHMIAMSNLHMLNDEGRSYAFDSRGTGYGRGEGVASIIVKRLEDALRDGDPIRAVIRNTGVNQDGKTNGITLPSQDAQQALEEHVYRTAGIDPHTIDYVEAHGTGTVAGDLAEMRAISNVFCLNGTRSNPLYVGSIKSNIGHLECCSGLAGLIKTVMMLEKQQLVPNPNLEALKRDLRLESWNMKIPRKLEAPPNGFLNRASVNSFGYGGANAHTILEVAPSQQMTNGVHEPTATPKLFTISAKSEASLKSIVEQFTDWFSRQDPGSVDLANLAYTLGSRRSIMQWRSSFAAATHEELAGTLTKKPLRVNKASTDNRITYLFTGQGAQWHAMGRELIPSESAFKESIEKSDALLTEFGASWSLLTELQRDKSTTNINKSEIAQPASTALQIALVDLLDSFGVKPKTVIGHSSGEIAAAYAAGALSHESALMISYQRSFIGSLRKQKVEDKGAMAAVGLGEQEATPYVAQLKNGKVVLACVNSPSSVTVSGDEAGIVELEEFLKRDGVFVRRLMVDTAYHSHHMRAVSDDYHAAIRAVESSNVRSGVRFISSVTGQEKTSGFGADYWVENLLSQVKYSQALEKHCRVESANAQSLHSLTTHTMVEIGSHSALSGPTRQVITALALNNFKHTYAPSLVRNEPADLTILKLAGTLFEAGSPINLTAANSIHGANRSPRVLHNLPPYAWDHSTSYWHESRLSKNYRFRKFPYHDLLGLRIESSTPLEPSWRHLITMDRLPWLAEHVIDGAVLFPGAGYICMALEASKQITLERHPHAEVVKLFIKDLAFMKALVVPDAPGKIEVQISLRPAKRANGKASSWEEFRITAGNEDGIWSEHCRGLVRAETADSAHLVEEYVDLSGTIAELQEKCTEKMEAKKLYEELQKLGNTYGSNFAVMKDLHLGDTDAIGTVEIPDVSKVMPGKFQQPHIIHPSTLDALMHAGLPIYARKCGVGSIMPLTIGEMMISTSIDTTPGKLLYAATSLAPKADRSAMMSLSVASANPKGTSNMVLSISNEQVRGVGASLTDGDQQESQLESFGYKWGPDVDFSVPALTGSERPVIEAALAPEEKLRLLNEAAAYFIELCVVELEKAAADLVKGQESYLEWLRSYREKELGGAMSSEKEAGIKGRMSEVRNSGVEGEMLCRIGENLASILKGDVDARKLMLADDLLHLMSADDSSLQSYAAMTDYVKHLAFKNPNMKVLELGAAYGGATLPFLEALGSGDQLLLDSYTFTDTNDKLFERSKELLKPWQAALQFKTLDILTDPAKQGFELGSYDLVVASNFVSRQSCVNTSLNNVRRLLRPGGRVLLLELTNVPLYVSTIFGTLPEWWAGVNDKRKEAPTLDLEHWDRRLSQTGYEGVEVVANDFEDAAQRGSMIVSKVPQYTEKPTVPVVEILAAPEMGDVAKLLHAALASQGLTVKTVEWSSKFTSNAIQLVLDNGMKPLLADPSPEEFKRIMGIASECSSIFWITAQEPKSHDVNPEKGLISGFARTARSEYDGLNFAILDVQQSFSSAISKLLPIVSNMLVTLFSEEGASIPHDQEFVYRNDQLLIPRLVQNTPLNQWVVEKSIKDKMVTESFHEEERPLKLRVLTPGLLDSLCFVDDDSLSTPLPNDQLEISVRAFGVNDSDVAGAAGHSNESSPLGEYAGIVTGVGSALKYHFRVGDHVCGLGSASYASRVRVPGTFATRIPTRMLFSDAASIPISFMTAFHVLEKLADVERGQRILILNPSSGLGQAAIMVANLLGAEPLVTVSGDEEMAMLMSRFGLSDINFLPDNPTMFKKAIKEGVGNVDLIFSNISGELLQTALPFVVPFGMVVRPGVNQETVDTVELSERNLTYILFDLATFVKLRSKQASRLFGEVMSLFETEKLHPVHSITRMSLSEIDSAFKLVNAGKHTGKLVLDAKEDTTVKVLVPPRPALELKADATYIIAGGLGDLGQRIGRLMISHGARHIVLLSRKTLSAREEEIVAQKLANGVADADVRAATCDITDLADVERMVAEHKKSGRPVIKGVVQGAMVLRDRPIEQMTLEDWTTTLSPKVAGTRNLSKALESNPLDFFVMLSSAASTVGNKGQANYAAGNAFEDMFANEMQTSGTHYVALNLGIIADAELLSDGGARQKTLARQGYLPVTNDQLFSLLEYSMNEQCRVDDCHQAVIGFDGHSLSTADDQWTAHNPQFGHVLRSRGAVATKADGGKLKNIKDMLAAASTTDEARDIVIKAIIQKISALVALKQEDVNMELSLTDFGLDSLVAVELKNWITKEFAASLQTIDILDTPNIPTLAGKIIEKSKLFDTNNVSAAPAAKEAVAEVIAEIQQEAATPAVPDQLPLQPISSLDDIIADYKISVRAFCNEEEFENTSKLCDEFLALDGPARKYQGRLLEKYNTSDNWVWEDYNDSNFLTRRVNVYPFNIVFGSHVLGKVQQTQSERASIVSTAAFKFKNLLTAGKIPREVMNEQPLCDYLLKYQFNTTRVPGVGKDHNRYSPGNDYIIVMRRGHIYKVDLSRTPEADLYAMLKSVFDEILTRSEDEVESIAALTSDERNSWARNREMVMKLSPETDYLITTVEDSAFVICLDDASPEGGIERSYQFLTGPVTNRWADKSVQFVVCTNGTSAYIMEHSLLDGTTLKLLNDFITEAIDAFPSSEEQPLNPTTEALPLVELIPTINSTVSDHITRVKKEFLTNIAPIECHPFVFTPFGGSIFKPHKLPPKSSVAMLIQLASRMHFGYSPAAWETVSYRPFHKGRVEIANIIVQPVMDFLVAATDPKVSMTEKRRLFGEAAKAHASLIARTGRGKGFDRHLSAMRMVIKKGEPVPSLYRDPIYERTRPRKIMMGCHETTNLEGGFALRDPENIWAHHEVQDDLVKFSIVGTKGNTGRFVDCLHKAADIIRSILDA